ncbi:MAG: hypothetical protein RJA56_1195 [Pseudomonadota bacterium]|jgi:hypothetical protein
MLLQRWMWIAWPAFLVAGLMEMAVFAVVDPADLNWMGSSINGSREAVYTVAFFVFWALAMLSSALTTLLSLSPLEVNRCPVPASERPESCCAAASEPKA